MAIPKRVQKHLESNKAKHVHVPHRTVYTAYDAAQTLRRKLEEIAKNVLVKTDGGWAIIIVPSNRNVDFKKLKAVMKKAGKTVASIKIPDEKAMIKFLGVKMGALPSFGSLHDLEVYVDKALAKSKRAIFATGSFEDSVEMAVKDFIKLEQAVLGAFSAPKKLPKQITVRARVLPKKRKPSPKKRRSARTR